MKTVFTPVDSRQNVILNPIYMTRDQWECAYYIPMEDRSRIIIVDFIEEDADGTNSFTKNDSCSKATDTSI